MGRITVSIPVEADREYVKAVGKVAEKRSLPTTAALVKLALEAYCGADIQRAIEHSRSFFDDDGTQKVHTNFESVANA